MINKKDRTIQNLMDLYSKGLEEKALKEAVGATILNPNSAKILNIIASVKFKLGQRTSCLKFYTRALKIQPNLAEAHNNIGYVSSDLDEFSSACDSFKRAIILNPNYPEACNNYGLALSIIGQQDNAVSCFKMSLYAYPDFFDALIKLVKLGFLFLYIGVGTVTIKKSLLSIFFLLDVSINLLLIFNFFTSLFISLFFFNSAILSLSISKPTV